MEHEAAGGSVDKRAIFGRSLVLSFNLVGQPTDALLHASLRAGEMKSREENNVAGMSRPHRWMDQSSFLTLLCQHLVI